MRPREPQSVDKRRQLYALRDLTLEDYRGSIVYLLRFRKGNLNLVQPPKHALHLLPSSATTFPLTFYSSYLSRSALLISATLASSPPTSVVLFFPLLLLSLLLLPLLLLSLNSVRLGSRL